MASRGKRAAAARCRRRTRRRPASGSGRGNPASGDPARGGQLVRLVPVVQPVAIDEAMLEPDERDVRACALRAPARVPIRQPPRRSRATSGCSASSAAPASSMARADQGNCRSAIRRALPATIGQQSQPRITAACRRSSLAASARRIACRDFQRPERPAHRRPRREPLRSAQDAVGWRRRPSRHQRRARKFVVGPDADIAKGSTGGSRASSALEHRPDVRLGAAIVAAVTFQNARVDERRDGHRRWLRCCGRASGDAMAARASAVLRTSIVARRCRAPDGGGRSAPDAVPAATPQTAVFTARSASAKSIVVGRCRSTSASAARIDRKRVRMRLFFVQIQLGKPPERIVTIGEPLAERPAVNLAHASAL